MGLLVHCTRFECGYKRLRCCGLDDEWARLFIMLGLLVSGMSVLVCECLCVVLY